MRFSAMAVAAYLIAAAWLLSGTTHVLDLKTGERFQVTCAERIEYGDNGKDGIIGVCTE